MEVTALPKHSNGQPGSGSIASFLSGPWCVIWLILSAGLISGCGAVMSSASVELATNLQRAVMNHNDPETVKSGAPAWLLMIDSLIQGDPENVPLLMRGAMLYNAYTSMFVTDAKRAKRLTDKAMNYAIKALCVHRSDACDPRCEYPAFVAMVNRMGPSDIGPLFALGSAWAGWIQARKSDMAAIAEISRIEVIMNRVIVLDDTYQDGAAHMYLGVLKTLLPPAYGGQPGQAKAHFQRAMDISQGQNLMVAVMFAEHYGRMAFDRQLHDQLLHSVLNTDPEIEGYTLTNLIAQEKARELLETADEYF